MKTRRIPIMLIALAAVVCLIHPATQAQPGAEPTVEAAAPVVTPAASAEEDSVVVVPADKEVTPEALGAATQKVVKDWKTYGWLAGLAALVSLLLLVLKYKPIDALFERWGIKWTRAYLAILFGGISAGLTAYMVDGDVVSAIIAGLVLIGPAAIGFFEALSKIRARNRDKGGVRNKPHRPPGE